MDIKCPLLYTPHRGLLYSRGYTLMSSTSEKPSLLYPYCFSLNGDSLILIGWLSTRGPENAPCGKKKSSLRSSLDRDENMALIPIRGFTGVPNPLPKNFDEWCFQKSEALAGIQKSFQINWHRRLNLEGEDHGISLGAFTKHPLRLPKLAKSPMMGLLDLL